jgi:hypothetical protein
MFLAFENRITERTSQSMGLVIGMVVYETQQPIHSLARQVLETWQMIRRQLSTFESLLSMTCGGQDLQMVLTLKITLIHSGLIEPKMLQALKLTDSCIYVYMYVCMYARTVSVRRDGRAREEDK